MAGARPVFADIDPERLTLDPAAAERAITEPDCAPCCRCTCTASPPTCRRSRRSPAARDLALVEDCCQAHLATCAGQPVGTFGAAGAFSFYPTKNLGALGDGGAVMTRDAALAARIARLRNGGQTDRYHHVEIGINSRLDEMQAAILRARLPRLRARTEQRRALAAQYRSLLAGAPSTVPPEIDPGHVYHLFPIRARHRAALQDRLRASGIETLVHYPIPISQQPAFASPDPAECPHAARAASEVLSLPLLSGAVRRDRHDGRGGRSKGIIFVRALITGGAGFIGSHLAEALLNARARSRHHRQPVDGLDTQRRPPEVEPALQVHHRHAHQRAAPRRADRSQRRHLSFRRSGRRQADRRRAGAHDRDQRARHRSRAEAREQEEERRSSSPRRRRCTARASTCRSARTPIS